MGEGIGDKKPEDGIEKQKALISHFVGTFLLKASFLIEDGQNANEIKNKLIETLGSEVKGSIVNEMLGLIGKSDWSTVHSLESFRAQCLQFEKRHSINH